MNSIVGIYLDYNATTPCDPRVVKKMLPFFTETFGNPSNGLHIQGRNSSKAIEFARDQVANLIDARGGEIVFTSGATESDNLAILGIARINKDSARKKIVTSAIEHKAVLLACKKLKEEGFELEILPVDSDGRVSLDQARQVIDKSTLLVTIHGANNEIGTIQPVQQLADLAHKNGALFHCDGAQAVGKIPVSVNEWDVDLLSISAHKLYGPKGVGALYIRGGIPAIPLESIWYGGGQEGGLRSGTMNVPGIVGFGEASAISMKELLTESKKISYLRDQLEQKLIKGITSLIINARKADRLPNTTSLTFPGLDADALILNANQIMIGTGSACTSGAIEPSHVLTAIGLSRELAASTIRVSLGRFTSDEDIIQANTSLHNAWKNLSN
jgi:cysteine desulfurase